MERGSPERGRRWTEETRVRAWPSKQESEQERADTKSQAAGVSWVAGRPWQREASVEEDCLTE